MINVQIHKDIRVLSPIYGFFIGAIVTSESSFYETFEIWAELKSTITDDAGKTAQLCEFIEEEKGDALSKDLHWKVAEKQINIMTSVEDIDAFIEGEDRKPVLESVEERKKELNAGTSANKDQN